MTQIRQMSAPGWKLVICAICVICGPICGCAPAPLLTIHREPTTTGTRLTLIGAPGARINARLLPALELKDGSVLRFTGNAVTADSSYFTVDPTLEVTGDPSGMVRASVCPTGEKVCRRVEIVVR